MNKIVILIHCRDQKGIIAAVTNYIASIEGNIIYLDQHVDGDQDVFFMRLECEFGKADFNLDNIKDDFHKNLAIPFSMSWSIQLQQRKPRMAIFVSKYDHCLYDILSRYSTGELHVEIPIIISNHNDLSSAAERFSISFQHILLPKKIKNRLKKNRFQY